VEIANSLSKEISFFNEKKENEVGLKIALERKNDILFISFIKIEFCPKNENTKWNLWKKVITNGLFLRVILE